MAFTDKEKESIRYHLGYPNLQMDKSLQFGVVRTTSVSYLIDSVLEKIPPDSEDRCRTLISAMDCIELRMQSALSNVEVDAVDNVKMRKNAHDALETEYTRWGYRMSEVIGCPPYWLSERYKGGHGSGPKSVPVRR